MLCPICRRPLAEADTLDHQPFCSERCRLVDLSKWLGGEYIVPGPPVLDGPTPSFDFDQE